MGGTVSHLAVNTNLVPALVNVTSGLVGDQSNLANRIEALRNRAHAKQMDDLSDALLGLAANADATDRNRILMASFGESRTIACDIAVMKAQSGELLLLVDMLKWPICAGSRSGIALQILRMKNADPAEFGRLDGPKDPRTFHLELPLFVIWLKGQRDDAGKPLNLKGPPMFIPMKANQGSSTAASPNEPSGRAGLR